MTSRKILAVGLGVVMVAALGFAAVSIFSGIVAFSDVVPATGQNEATHSVPANEWITINAQVVTHTDNSLTITTDDGQEMEMGLGPVGYWYAHGIDLNPGDSVSIKGFYTDEFEPAQVLNKTTGNFVILRLEDGSPAWAGNEHGGGES